MPGLSRGLLALFTVAALGAASPARAVVSVVFGSSWDGPSNELQAVVDNLYGAGSINVQTGYLGARPGDPDPWFWLDNQLTALLVKEVAGNASHNQLGWYEEAGATPVLRNDGIHDGMIFDGPAGPGATALVTFTKPMTRFGFYLNPNGPGDATNAPEPEKFYTNRLYNDVGPNGGGALQAPWNGDVQALVYDISRLRGPNTWLVCFEDLDAGAMPGPPGQAQTDNDFNDFIFEVTAFGATPAHPLSFGALKSKYAR